ncbi:MAG TPA: sigma-70 family RNA polymerase sigma factor [Clostridiaceae bacterium]|nr:sigma-70 family RNA polymerase sigma factor [Clostridiaceae bacterium]
MDDLMIIELYFARDEQAIKETDVKYGKLCYNLANNILGNNEDSEECVNDTYLSVWNKIPPTRPNNFMAFICKIVRNLSMKKLDFNRALKHTQNITASFSELEEILSYTRTVPNCEYEELGKLISNFLRQEKEDARNVFIRRYYFFDSISDIASRYSFTESKVKNMLYRSRNKLREYLKKEGIEV